MKKFFKNILKINFFYKNKNFFIKIKFFFGTFNFFSRKINDFLMRKFKVKLIFSKKKIKYKRKNQTR